MGSLGETLRQARLDRGATLADAEQETKIRRRYLEALEAEDYAALPPLVYTRGFIRSYARYLGLEPEATLDLFAPARVREERPAIRSATPQLAASRSISMRIFLLVAGVVLAGFLLTYLWTQYNSFVDSLGQADQAVSSRGGASSPGRPVAAPSPSIIAVAPTLEVASPPPPAPAPERGVVVEARVTERTWMEVWVDGASQLQATLQAGTVRTFSGQQSVKMRVGNAGGVQVTVNGEQRGPLGEKNQVKELVWER